MICSSLLLHFTCSITLCLFKAGDGSVYIISSFLESGGLVLQQSVTLQPLLPLYSVTTVDENRIFVGSRGGFVLGIRCSVNGVCVQESSADLSLGIPVRTLSHTICRYGGHFFFCGLRVLVLSL